MKLYHFAAIIQLLATFYLGLIGLKFFSYYKHFGEWMEQNKISFDLLNDKRSGSSKENSDINENLSQSYIDLALYSAYEMRLES